LRKEDRKKGIMEKYKKVSLHARNSIGDDFPEGNPNVHAVYKKADVAYTADEYEREQCRILVKKRFRRIDSSRYVYKPSQGE